MKSSGGIFDFLQKRLLEKLPDNNADTSACLIFASFGSFFSTLGLVLMKYAHVKKMNGKLPQNKSVFTSCTWIIGMLSLALGSVFNIVALNVGNQFLLASTCSLSIIFNTILSVCFLKERFHNSDLLALSIIAFGCTLFMVSARNSKHQMTNAELTAMYLRLASIIYIVTSLICIVSGWIYDGYVVKLLKNYNQEVNSLVDHSPQEEDDSVKLNMLVHGLGIVHRLPDRKEILSQSTFSITRQLRIPILIMGPIGGLLASLQQSFMRGFTISLTNPDGNQNPFTYFYLTLGLTFAVFQLLTINRMMTIYPQLEIQPIYETSLILFNMLAGAVILGESDLYTNQELGILFSYAIMMAFGVFILVRKVKCMNCDGASKIIWDEFQSKHLNDKANTQITDALNKFDDEDERNQVQKAIDLILQLEQSQKQGLK